MVGLVIISHSRALAKGVAELARGVGEHRIPLAVAGGTGENHNELGTDATDIMEAIQEVDSPDGICVLMDLGSAILSAETALEFLEGTLAGPVRLVPAPLVEGAVAAAVQIGLGADLDTVVTEALDAIAPKREQLGMEDQEDRRGTGQGSSDTQSDSQSEDFVMDRYRVMTSHGLHARPAARLVQTVARYQARGEIRNPERASSWVNAASMNRVATLQIRHGDEFEIRFSGADAEEALEAVAALVEENFGEEGPPPTAETEPPSEPSGEYTTPDGTGWIRGIPASPGIAIGPVMILGMPRPCLRFDRIDSAETREETLDTRQVRQGFIALRKAVETVAAELRRVGGAELMAGQRDAGGIAEAHATLITDPELMSIAADLYARYEVDPVEAFWFAAERIADEYRRMDDAYMQARAIDLLDVAVRLVNNMAPERIAQPELPSSPAILMAEDLLPSHTMRLDAGRVLAIVTTAGSASSHAAIIARGLGIPMVAGVSLPARWESALVGKEIVVDGSSGTVEISPAEERRMEVAENRERRRQEQERLKKNAQQRSSTTDGTVVPVMANVATTADAGQAAVCGADGVGLLRTEFFFLGHPGFPDEEEQLAALRAMSEPFGDRPITVRLLDVGGDKEAAALRLPREKNPFLGLRGVRLLLREGFEELLTTHLRAVLRLSADRPVKVMVPMVALIEEIREMRSRLVLAREALLHENVPHGWPLDLGIMVETPAVAFMADRFARFVDFFSIGTNDLTQYVMAAERGNSALAGLADGLHPAVLKAISASVDGANSTGIPVSVCGELGADPEAVPVLLGCGVQSLSVNAGAVITVKEQIRGLSLEKCRRQAQTALRADVAGAVRGGAGGSTTVGKATDDGTTSFSFPR